MKQAPTARETLKQPFGRETSITRRTTDKETYEKGNANHYRWFFNDIFRL